MRAQFAFRLDDVCPTMNWKMFNKLQLLFDKYDIKPIIGIIPDNKDKKLMVDDVNGEFWSVVKKLHERGWIIAQHGYQHLYVTKESGLIGLNNYSEFAGLSHEEQCKKIIRGKTILEEKFKTKILWWMAPAHSFDRITCKILRDLGFKYITDGIALFPYIKYGLNWVPQQIWKPQEKLFGFWTICIHPNNISDSYINNLEQFILRHSSQCLKIDFTPRACFLNIAYNILWRTKILVYRLIKK